MGRDDSLNALPRALAWRLQLAACMSEFSAPSLRHGLRFSSRAALLATLLVSGVYACDVADDGGNAGQGGAGQSEQGAAGAPGGSGGVSGGGGVGGEGGMGGNAPAITLDPGVIEAIEKVRASDGGLSAISVLRDIIAAAGFDQVDSEGNRIFPAEAPAQGIAFEMADAELIALGLDGALEVPLDDLLAGWGSISAELNAEALRPKLIADLQAAAASTDPTRRFWAQAIAQLGRTASAPFDLLDPAVPGSAPLDALQTALLTYRFQAELWSQGQKAPRVPLGPPSAIADARPCTMTETEQTVMDVAALANSTFFGQLIEHLGETIPAAEKLSKFGAGANAALTVIKLLWTFAAFDGHMESDTDGIVRNWDGTADGDDATLTATFRYDIGRAQAFNCVRPALNLLGIDFSLPQDGPVADARVDWEMFDVKDRQSPKPIVRYQAGNLPLNRRTDAQGEDRISVEGTKKDPPLSSPVAPDHRSVFLAAKVALKDTKMWQDIQDAVGTALAGNPASIALSVISETLVRMNTMVFSARYRLPVQDHQPLDNVIVRVELSGSLSGAVTSNGQGSESVDATLSLVEKPAEGDQALQFVFFNGQPSVAVVSLAENGLRDVRYRGQRHLEEPCVCIEGTFIDDERADWLAVRVGDEKDPRAVLATMLEDGSYTINLPLGEVKGKGWSKVHSSGCEDPTVDESEKLEVFASLGEITITGQVDPTKASGTIEGSISPSVDVKVPASLGGFYAGGVAHTTVRLNGTVDYVFSYTRTTVTLPPGTPVPPLAPSLTRLVGLDRGASERQAGAMAPAFASLLRREQPIACRSTPTNPASGLAPAAALRLALRVVSEASCGAPPHPCHASPA